MTPAAIRWTAGKRLIIARSQVRGLPAPPISPGRWPGLIALLTLRSFPGHYAHTRGRRVSQPASSPPGRSLGHPRAGRGWRRHAGHPWPVAALPWGQGLQLCCGGVSGYSRQEVARRAGVDPGYVDRLVELGILTPAAADAFSPGDAPRARGGESLE